MSRAALFTVLATALVMGLDTGRESRAADYVIGADDVLAVSVWENKELDQVVVVRPDGKISLPLAGEVQAGGTTVGELTRRLALLYGDKVIGAQVTVSVREIKSRTIFFVGGVVKPGPMQLTQDLTVLQALSAAGGPLPSADLERAFVVRGERAIAIDFLRLLQKADMSQNIKLEPGDTVLLPVADIVYVQGEVRTPGALKFSRDLTVVKAIAQAGGFTNLAAPSRVALVRDGPNRQHMRVNVQDMMTEQAAADLPLRPNDIIIVPQRLF